MVFKKGETTNPKGNNGLLKGYQRYADRAAYLTERYTVGEIIALVSDPVKFKKLPIRDGQIIMHLASTLTGDDKRLEREALLDRIEGKPAQYIETKNETTIEHTSVSATSEWIEDTLGGRPVRPPEKPVLN